MKSGRFIVLEGIDGSGTTTQAQFLVTRLQEEGFQTHLTHEPSEGPIGLLIHTILKGATEVPPPAMALLFAADRLDHISREVDKALERGCIVISDRYLYSSLAYQSVDTRPTWVAQINSFAPQPDLSIFLDIEPDIALQRIAQRTHQEIYENHEFLNKVATRYRELFIAARNNHHPILHIQDDLPIQDVADMIYAAVRDHLDNNHIAP